MQGYLFKRGVVLIYIYEIYYTDNSLKNIYTSFSQGLLFSKFHATYSKLIETLYYS